MGLALLKEKPRFVDEDDVMDDFTVREGLSWKARKLVDKLRTIARGVMLVTGEPGGGKDLFAISTASLFKFTMNRRILLDFVPRWRFGDYVLCDTHSIIEIIREIAKSRRVEGIEGSADKKELAQFMESETVKWLLEGEGYELFKGAVWYISELKKVAYNRNPMSATNKFIGTVCTVWRHLDLLLMGTHVKANEIDVKAFLEYAKLRAVCSQTVLPGVCIAKVHRGIFTGPDFVVSNVALKPLIFTIDGNEPRDYLEGEGFFSLYRTKHMKF